ncbi:hypothetical protein QTP86_008583 [Hemibagrus guttatus]|nr:hypothetical protein QTP86_008583 [Hemibagrus guttatus]
MKITRNNKCGFWVQRATATDSLHWLLQEPLVHGARLDVGDSSLLQSLLTSGVTTLKHLVDIAGPRLKDVDRVAALLGVRSKRVIMWVCNLCRKQQEILIKSGAWFYGGAEGRKLGPEVKGHLDSSGLAVKSATGVPADR